MTAREKLTALEAAVRAAEVRVRDADAERRKAARSHGRALLPLREYWRQVGAGAERDPEREAELEEAVRGVRAAVTMQPVLADGRMTDLVPVDERLDAQLAGAREAHEAAVARRDSYLAASGPELVAEALPGAEEALASSLSALDAYREAASIYEAAVRELVRYGGPSDGFPEAPTVGDPAQVAAFRAAERRGRLAGAPE